MVGAPPRFDAVVFDAYGTLLDVESLADRCARIAPSSPGFLASWRSTQLELSWLRTIMGTFVDFDVITADALDRTLAACGADVDESGRRELLGGWLELDAYRDAAPALQAITALPRLVLSNGTMSSLRRVLRFAGLFQHLDAVISVDAARAFKPSRPVYALIESRLRSWPRRTLFVSSNDWDVAGAGASGFTTAWVNRHGVDPRRLDVSPDHVLDSLADVPGLLGR